ncbi:MAG: hypothetical protein IT556_08815 [Acetobacteraceae bacterium]|nr:hypothetical protein [Acetobacteraceae bacterium]
MADWVECDIRQAPKAIAVAPWSRRGMPRSGASRHRHALRADAATIDR